MRASILLLSVLWFQLGFSQSSNLNGYEYVIVPMEFEFQDEPNQYQLNILSRVLLKDVGFKVFMDTEDRPLEYRGNTCAPLFLSIEDTSGFLTTKLVIRLKDCYNNVVFESDEGSTKIKDFKEAYQAALKDAFSYLSEENYSYDSSLLENADSSTTKDNVASEKEQSKADELYPDRKVYKFGGSTYWLVKDGKNDYRIMTADDRNNYADLKNADKGTFIFNSKTVSGAAFFDENGNLKVEYMDEDLNEIQYMVFKKIDQ